MSQQKIHFYKMTGAGNDFVMIDNREGLLDADHCQDFVQLVCRHKLSVGADGVILIENDPEVDFKWRFFNADSSEAEMCGNGARCAARFVHLTGIVKTPSMAFRTLAGIVKAELRDNGRVKVQMTTPHDLQLDIHIESESRPFDLDFINTGVPHAGCFMSGEELKTADVQQWGRAIRYHSRFQPAGANANFISVNNKNQIAIRTYERGVEGETLACGTGCTAAALMCAAKSKVVSPVEVKTQGGESLIIYFKQDKNTFTEVYLEGEAKVAYEADLWEETLVR
jgi:diaminopimelate epimerase